jgi:asparagine synthase (glutamine-hydrolysing)
MSGFAGIVCADRETPDPRLLDCMVEHLRFRGPDSAHIWRRPGAGFCFTLLCTGPSPQAATQPCSVDGRVWLLGDVRLDDREELIDRLQQSGQTADGDATNEELVLRAWRQWGEAGLANLMGDLSFALWDAQERKLWCLRDFIGARPFFYAHAGSRLVFSNALNAVRLAPEFSAKLDPHFIGDFLLQSCCSDAERTAFQDIRRLPPGHVLCYSNAQVQVRRYSRLPVEEPLLFKRPEEYLEQFRELLEQAIRERLPRAGVGVFMSGGLDSTSVAATAKRVQTARGIPDSVRAHTVDYTPLFDDPEGAFASQAAEHIGIPLGVLHGADCSPFEACEDRSFATPEPCADPFLALQVKIYLQLGSQSRVAFTGDGGDDILTGRAWPHLTYLLRRGQVGALMRFFGGYILRHRALPPLRVGIRTRLRRLLGQRDESSEYPAWLEPRFEKQFHLRERWRKLQESSKPEHPLHPAAHSGLNSSGWSVILENEDAGWTGVPVETRAPLLDERLIRFLLRVPPVPWCMNKQLLREAMRGLLPEEVRLRRKTPLSGDPLQIHEQKNGWKPVLPKESCERLADFVNCRMLSATFRSNPGLALWDEIRPVALGIWLKGVENTKRIQYSRCGGN